MLQMKSDFNQPASLWDFKMFESVKGRMHQRMPAQVTSYKLTLWAFGSGELKTKNIVHLPTNTYIVGTQKNHLTDEMVLFSTHNMFWFRYKKTISELLCLSSDLKVHHFCTILASVWDYQQCGTCDQQSLRSACAYVQSDQSLC